MITAIKNVTVITPMEKKDEMVVIEDGKILGVFKNYDLPSDAKIIDGKGMYLTPGFIDIHVHGGGGCSTMNLDADGVITMAEAHSKLGTTSIVPTTLAVPLETLAKAADAVKIAAKKTKKSNILGIHLEGPFLSKNQRGAQSEDNCLIPAEHDYETFLDQHDNIRIMGAAPELPGALELGRSLRRRGIVASIAHSDATYDEVVKAIDAGYSDVTHIYSGCSMVRREMGYRIPGIVEAGLLLDDLTVQIIADLKHLPPAIIKLIYKCKGADKITLITDALDFAGTELKEGTVYTQENGVSTVYEDGVMKLMDRQAFAGSVATCDLLVRNMYKGIGMAITDSVRMATLTPAKVLGIDDKKGKISEGYDADLVLFDENVNVKFVMVGGNIVVNNI